MKRTIGSRIAAALLLAAIVVPVVAGAAEPVFPIGSRLGLVPPPGLAPSKNFLGFVDTDKKVVVLLAALPVSAYGEIEKSLTPASMKKQGIVQLSREPLSLAIGKAFLVVGRQQLGTLKLRKWLLVAATPKFTAFVTAQIPEEARSAYPDAAIRTALSSLAIRAQVPDKEKLSLLPFKLADLAGFKIGSVIPGRAILLSDAATDNPGALDRPRILVGAMPATPAQMDDRDTLARRIFSSLAGIEEVRITEAGALRIGGKQGHQVLATAKDIATGTELTIVQWIRFGGGGFLQMVGISPTKVWKEAYPRFRAVRDSIEPR